VFVYFIDVLESYSCCEVVVHVVIGVFVVIIVVWPRVWRVSVYGFVNVCIFVLCKRRLNNP